MFLTIAVCLVPLLVSIIDFLRLIVHKPGQTLPARFLGYPTLPMLRAGGVSASLERPPIMILMMVGLSL